MSSNPESLTPDAALLEADAYPQTGIGGELIRTLAQALRASLDREREMREALTDAQQQVEVLQPGGTYAWKTRAELAERELSALADEILEAAEMALADGNTDYAVRLAAELQRLKEGKP